MFLEKPNIHSSNSDPFASDNESIHIACCSKNDTYDFILINEKNGGKHSQLLVYNAMDR
jgi:hypothetical protein